MFNKNISIFFVLIALLAVVSANPSAQHILSKFDSEFSQMHSSIYKNGDTSHAFSIAMKIFVAVEALKGDLDIQSPEYMSHDLFASDEERVSCVSMLLEVAEKGNKKGWINQFQEIYARVKKLNQKCTNMDFEKGPALKNAQNGVTGGFQNKCALCVVVTKVIENYIKLHNKDVTDFIEREFCDLFDGVTRPTCQAFVHYAGPYIIKALLNKENADVSCLQVGFCQNPECRISAQFIADKQLEVLEGGEEKPAPWEWLVHIFADKFGDGHLPPFDLDNDTFSDISTFRGYNWRGVDCNELSRNVYPGRKTGKDLLDHDCNGIYGLNPKSLKSYEKQFCSNSTRLGLAVIGDSAGAHFSIPEKYFNASQIIKGTYNDLLERAANQLDIPHESGYTGNTNTKGYTRHSVYKYLRDWNMCNNNDYQNVAVNGGDSGNSFNNIPALKRSQQNDHPLLMFLELIGNDVCVKKLDDLRNVVDFKKNILRLLNYINDHVPKGSHLMILGLADGDILYDNLHDSLHPLNVTYDKVYDFLNCLKISPCWSWLNSNQTVRKYTTERAHNLSKVYQEIINDGTTFENFDMVYYDFPTYEILERKQMEGGDPKDLIQKCDGFHPNGEFHSDLADWLWNKLQTNHLDWIGTKNIHNEEIRKIFGLEVLK